MRAVLTILLILLAPAVTASELRITVEGIRSPHGTILGNVPLDVADLSWALLP